MTQLTAHHHALLFSSISLAVICEIGENKGELLIRKAVRKYGLQRGKRMALRALKNGHALTMDNYLAYSEWKVPKDTMKFRFIEKNPHARINIVKCPWNIAWKENNLLEYGKYFCKEIDTALVKGFNPDLTIDIHSTQTNGDKLCDFVFKEARLSLFKIIGLLYKKKFKPGSSAIMPWDYHTGHLYKTMRTIIRQELGDKTNIIMENSLNRFASFFSKECIPDITKYEDTDFEKLP
jgi:hypothetical protein